MARLASTYCPDGDFTEAFECADLPINVHLRGSGGLTFRRAQQQLPAILALHPQIIIMDIGSNDLCNLALTLPTLFTQFLDVVHHLLRAGVQRVYVLPVLPRVRQPFHSYNCRIITFNYMLRDHCDQDELLTLWRHRPTFTCCINPNPALFLRDGVHLSPLGMLRYYRTIRAAIAHAARNL